MPVRDMSNAVHVWVADVDTLQVDDTSVDHMLCPSEQARAQRFAFADLRRRYRISRAALRTVLAYCTGRRAAGLVFSLLPHGKPVLEGGPEFNVSMSGPMLLIAVGSRAPLGIDIEVITDFEDMDRLCQRYFSNAEQAALAMLTGEDRRRGFYRIWTRKEAVIKALGLGLDLDLPSFSVPLDSFGTGDRVVVEASPGDLRSYFVRPLDVSPHCEAAIASTLPVALDGLQRIGDGLNWSSPPSP